MSSKVVVPGARRALDDKNMPMFDKKHRPLWRMPKPAKYVQHFKSAGMRLKFERGEITKAEATKTVPVYRGFPNEVFQAFRHAHLRKQRRRKQFVGNAVRTIKRSLPGMGAAAASG